MTTHAILLIDTSSSPCQVALSGQSLLTRFGQEQRQSAQSLLPMIAELAAEAKLALSALDAVAVMAGPGSFTGLRIGVGVAQALCMANKTPGITLSNLAAMALSASQDSESDLFLVATVAREGEVYFGAYARDEKLGVRLVNAEQVAAPQALLLPSELDGATCVGTAWDTNAELLSLRERLTLAAVRSEASIDLATMAILASHYLNHGLSCEPVAIRPNYIKEQLDY